MATCNCCNKNEGAAREWDTLDIPMNQGAARKRVATVWLCDLCNDGQYPFYRERSDGDQILACPHEV